MDIALNPCGCAGEVKAPASKSYMHRLLICAALSNKETTIACNTISNDVSATIDCLRALGARAELSGESVIVHPIKSAVPNPVLNCNESGTTLRFMLPLCAALGSNARLIGSGRLPQRPIRPLCNALEKSGVHISLPKNSSLPCSVSGMFTGGTVEIEADVSSQFVSGLLLAMGKTGGEVIFKGKCVSTPYIDITLDVMRRFGVKSEKTKNGIRVFGGYTSPGEINCEGDWSNAAFWLVAGAIGARPKLTVKGLNTDSVQGDKEILDILKQMNVKTEINGNDVIVYKSDIKAFCVNAQNIPDLVPVLATAAACASGISVIESISRLREKESDRITATVRLLAAMGASAVCENDKMKILPTRLHGGTVDGYNDHRIVMSGAVAAFATDGEVKITDAEAVKKSYPAFFAEYERVTIK